MKCAIESCMFKNYVKFTLNTCEAWICEEHRSWINLLDYCPARNQEQLRSFMCFLPPPASLPASPTTREPFPTLSPIKLISCQLSWALEMMRNIILSTDLRSALNDGFGLKSIFIDRGVTLFVRHVATFNILSARLASRAVTCICNSWLGLSIIVELL